MRFYKLLCLARPQLPKEDLGEIIRMTTTTIYNTGGQVYDLCNHGDRPLDYWLRVHGDRYNKAGIWSLKFSPDTLRQKQSLSYLESQLAEDRRILRFIFQKLDHESLPAGRLADDQRVIRSGEAAAKGIS
ncbi:hypothetical protein WJX84_010054 [Apatococcus fuscideae]|uniref:Ribosomal protein S6 n=1 Tax=Apatococcus fuscideae TaxID=2026836 RepID=A0AAW1RVV6_9CHLO